jgi:tetratricopeptide (TPR) repeat protein
VTGRVSPAIVGVAILGFAIAIGLQVARDRRYAAQERETERILYVRSGAAVQRLALEFDALAADVYWIRAIQHYGGDRLSRERGRKYELLYPLLDLTTALDPYFTIAYRFGAIFLSEAYPGGPGSPEDARRLLEKGIAVEPNKWQYYYDIAFVYYWHDRDFKSAAQWFQKASLQPNAPNWLPPLVGSMLTAGEERKAARIVWEQVLQSDQEWLRRTAQRNLLQLDALDGIDQLGAIARRFPPPAGEAHSWEALVRRGILRGMPVDSTGTPFLIDPVTGDVSLSPQSPLHPLPDLARRSLTAPRVK